MQTFKLMDLHLEVARLCLQPFDKPKRSIHTHPRSHSQHKNPENRSMTAFATSAPIPQGKFNRPALSSLRNSCGRTPTLRRCTPCASLTGARIGHGFDLHRLEVGLPLILGGVHLEHDRGCAGHSDGDAVYHCVVDAVLGALSLPDIGELFPDTDPAFRDASSDAFMKAAHKRAFDMGYLIGNIDVTVILERPKLAPHKQKIRENVARLLHTALENVNVKAKTHEKVDAVGENRAVSVHAVALLVPMSGGKDDDAQRGTTEREDSDDDVVDKITRAAKSLLSFSGERASMLSELTMEGNESAMDKLYNKIVSRKDSDPKESWTATLFEKGRRKIAQKVGEEAIEVVIDAVANDKSGTVKESADLLYHLNVLWADMGVKPKDIWEELERREAFSGVKEKAARKDS